MKQLQLSHNQNGFTLIELIVTVAIAAIVLGIATPSFTTFIKNNRIVSETDKLVVALSAARQVAISRNTKGMLCRSRMELNLNNALCNTNSSSQLNWHEHNYLVYSIDPNNNTHRSRLANRLATNNGRSSSPLTSLKLNQLVEANSDTSPLVRLFDEGAFDGNLTINTNNRVHVIAFNSDGTLYNDAPIYFAICDDRDDPEEYGRYIEISQSGRIRSAKTNNAQTLTSCEPGA